MPNMTKLSEQELSERAGYHCIFGSVNSEGRIECEMLTIKKDGEVFGTPGHQTLPVKYQRLTDTATQQRRDEVLSLFDDLTAEQLDVIEQVSVHNRIHISGLPVDFRLKMREDMKKDHSKWPRKIDPDE